MALLKGKTVRRKAPVVIQDVVKVPTEIRQYHKSVTLSIDIFFVNGIPYFATLSLRICFLSVTHLTNRKIPTIFSALWAMHNFYLQKGFQIVFIKGDGEFKPLEEKMSELFGGLTMNLASANEHVPDIEQKIQVIKERVRAVVYSMPVNALPPLVVVHAVLFVTKQLNLFPVKGGISTQFSPRQIMTGEVVNYKFCSVPFGCYCQISNEGTPRNSMLARTEGALALGPSGNAQGGHKFWTLNTGSIVVWRQWVRLPMTEAVIARIDSKARGQPAQPVFTDRQGRPIVNVTMDLPYDQNGPEDLAPDAVTKVDDIPGVHLPDADGSDEIPGVDSSDQDYTDHADVDVGVDFNSPVPEEPALVDTGATDAVVSPPVGNIQGNPDGVWRSTRERKQVVKWKPSMQGKKYVFAALVLATTELGKSFYQEENYQYDAGVAFAFMQQLSLKSALNKWGDDAEQAGIKEVSQLHWRDTFVPKHYFYLQD